MYLLVLPVSGGGFVSQLAIVQHLCESQFVPDVTLASSGGNVSAYIGAAANWKWAGIQRIAGEMNKEMFAQSWNPFAFISYIIGFFEGDVFSKGKGVDTFLGRYFTAQTIKEHEIWTGTYNRARQKACIFCNRSKDESILDVDCIDHDLTQSMHPVFANGDIKRIARAGLASASIPALVPAEIIDGEPHIDGGIAGASPLIIMQEPILKYVDDHQSPLHIIYVNSVDLSSPNIPPCHNVIDTGKQAAKNMVRSQTVIDRQAAYHLLRCQPGKLHKEEFICNYANLQRVKNIQHHVKYSLLEIFPLEHCEVDLVSFTGADIITLMKKTYDHCSCRLWWLSDDTPHNVQQIIQECKSEQTVKD